MEFGRLMRRILGLAWLLLCAYGTSGWGQTDVVIRWVNEAGEPACQVDEAGHTLHISTWMDGVAQHAVQGADLVVDETGISTWNQAESSQASGRYMAETRITKETAARVANAVVGRVPRTAASKLLKLSLFFISPLRQKSILSTVR